MCFFLQLTLSWLWNFPFEKFRHNWRVFLCVFVYLLWRQLHWEASQPTSHIQQTFKVIRSSLGRFGLKSEKMLAFCSESFSLPPVWNSAVAADSEDFSESPSANKKSMNSWQYLWPFIEEAFRRTFSNATLFFIVYNLWQQDLKKKHPHITTQIAQVSDRQSRVRTTS